LIFLREPAGAYDSFLQIFCLLLHPVFLVRPEGWRLGSRRKFGNGGREAGVREKGAAAS
jgi:hypothetical protein